uniref:VOC domain-containing protein n=1 Tax=Picea sitchensis TaxID=3332 RepID=A9NZU5_PICSI|nr:unknown [Picea sitchensis]
MLLRSFPFLLLWSRLFNYGFGIHLLQCKSSDNLPQKTEINPTDNHISFQTPDILLVEKKLQEMDIKYEKRVVEDEGLYVDQLFFHDPDGYMVEICNCENLPVVPVTCVPSSVKSTFLRFAFPQSKPKIEPEDSSSEIALVPVNVATAQTDFPTLKKDIEATGRESPCLSDAHDDKKPYFLNIMDFYL